MRVEHCGHEHVLRMDDREVALLIDILEAALPAEKISGVAGGNPSLSRVINGVYAQMIDTARQVWQGAIPAEH
jgi:hypothetical protein